MSENGKKPNLPSAVPQLREFFAAEVLEPILEKRFGWAVGTRSRRTGHGRACERRTRRATAGLSAAGPAAAAAVDEQPHARQSRDRRPSACESLFRVPNAACAVHTRTLERFLTLRPPIPPGRIFSFRSVTFRFRRRSQVRGPSRYRSRPGVCVVLGRAKTLRFFGVFRPRGLEPDARVRTNFSDLSPSPPRGIIWGSEDRF